MTPSIVFATRDGATARRRDPAALVGLAGDTAPGCLRASADLRGVRCAGGAPAGVLLVPVATGAGVALHAVDAEAQHRPGHREPVVVVAAERAGAQRPRARSAARTATPTAPL